MALLKQIQAFFGVGILFVRKNGKVVYSVQSYNDLINVIIPRGRKI
jgi:ribosomal protein L24E